jgi:chemotaxis protein methyltransferase CheR
MFAPQLTDKEFGRIQKVMFDRVGVTIQANKKALVIGRLSKRLRHHNFPTYHQYLDFVESDGDYGEWQEMIDLLTTHETYFFREPKHFDFLQELAQGTRGRRGELRVWSAASSTGEEAYSAAMTLAGAMGHRPWEIFASDVSKRTVEVCRSGIYPQAHIAKVPKELVSSYFLKGVRSQVGKYMITRELRDRMNFEQINLSEPLPDVGHFDVIFLRNVLIYFDVEQKKQIVDKLLTRLKKGGYLLIGHSETLNGVSNKVVSLGPSIYQRKSDV